MEAYFDNSATTKALDSVRDIMVKTLTEDFGNPSAKHTKGMEAENYIRQAAADIAKTLKVKDKEILFTSGGTESNNMALIGTALANQRAGKHIISTRIEHASVYQPLAFLESLGFEVTYLHVDHNGHISLEELEQSLRPDTILVSVMYVNNETGAVQPISKIAKKIKQANSDILFVDASQGFEKMKNQKQLRSEDIYKITETVIHRKAVDKYSHLATLEEVIENDYNLNIPRYVDTFEEEEPIDLSDIQGQIDEVDAEIAKANQTLANHFKELGVLK